MSSPVAAAVSSLAVTRLSWPSGGSTSSSSSPLSGSVGDSLPAGWMKGKTACEETGDKKDAHRKRDVEGVDVCRSIHIWIHIFHSTVMRYL